jgi:molybdate transport system substrate-binding protein
MRRFLLLACLSIACGGAVAQEVTLFAAASLTNALDEALAAYAVTSGVKARTNYAASSALARQVEQGAPADIFLSADEPWMDYLAARKLVEPATRASRLSNRLVLVVPSTNPMNVAIAPGFNLAGLLGASGRLSTGDPSNVPAGRYAQQALTKLGVWGIAEPRLARADNVRAAMVLVERGEAPLGIVYATDAAVSSRVRVAGVFPADSHAPISYPFAIVAGRGRPEVRALFAHLLGGEAAAVFRKHGFTVQ